MRQRLTLAIVAVVAGALLVAGFGSLLLARRAARQDAERQLFDEALAVSTTTTDANASIALPALRRALRLEGADVIPLGPRCPSSAAAVGVALTEADCLSLRIGGHSGVRSDLAWAAAPVTVKGRVPAAVLLTRHVTGFRRGAGYLLVSGALALVVAAAVADWLGRRISRPVAQAEQATRRIAQGDLTATVPVPPGADPELASLARSINAMAEGLARSKGLERQFLLSVSHDLRTPLTSIRGYAEAIGDGTATDTARAADIIASESRRLERLVGDLLDLAKLDARRFSLEPRRIDAADVAAAVADSFGPAAADAGLAVRVDTPDEPLAVMADPDRLAQVAANLVENAFKFAASRIEVGARSDGGGQVLITVADDGPGIPADDLPRVFERLYQSSRTPARQAGSGLGLAIVAELVDAMGGSVRAVSPTEDSRGTRLEVRLPASGTRLEVRLPASG
jgi:two-component system sensor histidine kinase BaeS